MVIIWLMMVNNHLLGAWPTPLKNDGVSNSWDHSIPKSSNYKANHFVEEIPRVPNISGQIIIIHKPE